MVPNKSLKRDVKHYETMKYQSNKKVTFIELEPGHIYNFKSAFIQFGYYPMNQIPYLVTSSDRLMHAYRSMGSNEPGFMNYWEGIAQEDYYRASLTYTWLRVLRYVDDEGFDNPGSSRPNPLRLVLCEAQLAGIDIESCG